MTVTVVNTLSTPYVVDDEGHILAGWERNDVDEESQRAQHGVLTGQLRILETAVTSESVGALPAAPDPKERT
jgi:hypothetical protein